MNGGQKLKTIADCFLLPVFILNKGKERATTLKHFVIATLAILVMCSTTYPGSSLLFADNHSELHVMVGQMICAGFRGFSVSSDDRIVRDIVEYNLGGVILFDYDVELRSDERNVLNEHQLSQLTEDLAAYSSYPLLISIDQEGGYVARLKPKHGFPKLLSAGELGKIDDIKQTQKQGELTGEMLFNMGVNVNFAPVVDLNTNPNNPIIGRIERSFSSDPEKVVNHAQAFINGMAKYNVSACLKHFPGHGSSAGDSHLGMVDVTATWSDEELKPYIDLISADSAPMIMIGHLVNKNLDTLYPATLSEAIITGLLRDRLSYNGVIVSDDLGMKAITDHYSLQESVYLAIKSGVDILLYGNNMQYDENIVADVHAIIMNLVEDGKISEERIRTSYKRISKLKESINRQ